MCLKPRGVVVVLVMVHCEAPGIAAGGKREISGGLLFGARPCARAPGPAKPWSQIRLQGSLALALDMLCPSFAAPVPSGEGEMPWMLMRYMKPTLM